MNSFTFLLVLVIIGGAADAKTLRSNAASSEDIPTISSTRILLTRTELDSCYAVMNSTAVDDIIDKDGYVEFLDLLSSGYLTENNITSYDDLTQKLKVAWNKLTCQCVQMGRGADCCQADQAMLSVEGADGEQVSEAQVRFLNDVCKTSITTLGSEGWKKHPPPPIPPQETLTSEETMGMGMSRVISLLGIPFIFILILIGSIYFCRDMAANPEAKTASAALDPCHEEEQDDELADVEIALTASNLVQVTAKATKNLLPSFGKPTVLPVASQQNRVASQREKKLKRSPFKRLKKKIRRKKYPRSGELATPFDIEGDDDVDQAPHAPPRISHRVPAADQGK